MRQVVDYNDYKDKKPEQIHHFIVRLIHDDDIPGFGDLRKYWRNHSLQLANILNTTFNGGKVCLDKKHGFVVYKDIYGYTYDHNGLRWEDESEETDYIPIENLGSAKAMFAPGLMLGTNPNERKALMVKEYYDRHHKKFDYDELTDIVKEYAPKIFAEYDIITEDPFQVMYYKLVMDNVIKEDLWKENDFYEIA